MKMEKKELEYQQKVQAIVAQLRPIDDIMFQRLCGNPATIEEMLRVILEDGKIIVERVTPQCNIKNLYGRSVILDAYCKLGNGSYCNVEVQRSDDDNHFKRVRYNAACITANVTEPGERFEQVKDLIVIYISEFALFKENRTVFHVQNVVLENGELVPDGLRSIYVNAEHNDGSLIAELMQCFLQPEITNPNFPVLATELKAEKGNMGGDVTMCKIVEDFGKECVLDTLITLVQEQLLAPADAAKKANMSEPEFMKLVQEVTYIA